LIDWAASGFPSPAEAAGKGLSEYRGFLDPVYDDAHRRCLGASVNKVGGSVSGRRGEHRYFRDLISCGFSEAHTGAIAVLVDELDAALVNELQEAGRSAIAVKPERSKLTRMPVQSNKFANGQVFSQRSAPASRSGERTVCFSVVLRMACAIPCGSQRSLRRGHA
jgi:hypothetical protein